MLIITFSGEGNIQLYLFSANIIFTWLGWWLETKDLLTYNKGKTS